jgi:hypothetical protein
VSLQPATDRAAPSRHDPTIKAPREREQLL